MAELPPAETRAFDLAALGVARLNQALRLLDESELTAIVTGCTGQIGLCTGLTHTIKIEVRGSVGAYFGMLNNGADIEVIGDVGTCCGHSLSSGGILIRGHAGAKLGTMARAGFLGVHGVARDDCGLGLAGADIVVRQAVGARAGHAMRGGNLIIGGDAGHDLGIGATGGTIYLRGTAASIADTMREVKMRDSESMRLGLLLVRAGIRAATKEFRLYRPRGKSES